jgi:hypothetical protein
MDRDAFVQAIISELQNQKSVNGNKDNFFTGRKINRVELYRKLCYDFPVIDEYDAFDKLAFALENLESIDGQDISSLFTLNSVFTQNLIRMNEDASRPPIPPSEEDLSIAERKADIESINNASRLAIQSLSMTVFVSLSLKMLSMQKSRLSQLFYDDVSSIRSTLPLSSCIIENLEWNSIWKRFQRFICSMNISHLIQDYPLELLYRKKIIDHLLKLISLLHEAVYVSASNSSSSNSPNIVSADATEASLNESESWTLLESINMAINNNHEPASEAIAICNSILRHWIMGFVSIITTYPSLLSSQFPKLFTVLFDVSSSSSSSSSNSKLLQRNCPTMGEYLGLTALETLAINMMRLLIESTSSKEQEKRILDAIASLRRCLIDNQRYTLCCDLQERVLTLKYEESKRLAIIQSQEIDIDHAIWHINMLDILVYRTKQAANQSRISANIFSQLFSSRSVAKFLETQIFLFHHQHTLIQQSSGTAASSYSSSELWSMMIK